MLEKSMSKLNSIDLLKAVSALVIMIYHYRHLIIYSEHYMPELDMPFECLFLYIYKYGYLCVELFFVLSGFGMALHYERDKCLLTLSTLCAMFVLKIAGGGIWYLSFTVIFSMAFSCIIVFDFVEKALYKIRLFYKPLKNLSYPIFLTHYVVLTIMSFFDKKYNLQEFFHKPHAFVIYVFFAFLLAILIDKVIKGNNVTKVSE